MTRDKVYYVMPIGEVWLVRSAGSRAEAYPTYDDALAAAERLSARGADVRVLSRPGALSPGVARAHPADALPRARTGTPS